ncbi:MAG: ABC transporter ATP-binding protein [Treponema sp.]|jgi:ABC-2 type transport system ATP-binding protein|nr:ABC transporter ATP-binding protein [Treponema sp.]
MEATEKAPVLEITGLEKNFGNCDALQGVDMIIPAGQITGLLGPNASGKTTLLKTIAGLLQPTAGKIKYFQNAAHGPQSRKTVSFCPDTLAFPQWMKVRDAFTFYREMYSDYSQSRADELIRILELQNIQNKYVNKLSKGMKERLVLGLTFSRETQVYLLDEPLDGIDPVGKMRVIDTIIAMKPQDSSTLVSTHLVKDIERIFDSVFFLSKGKIVFSGNSETIREEKGKTVEQAYLEVFTSDNIQLSDVSGYNGSSKARPNSREDVNESSI